METVFKNLIWLNMLTNGQIVIACMKKMLKYET